MLLHIGRCRFVPVTHRDLGHCCYQLSPRSVQADPRKSPHRHLVLSIPKILRRYFLYNRKLLSQLSRCGWQSLKTYFKSSTLDPKALPGAIIAIQTFGDFLGFNPHLHILISDGCFHENGMFTVSPAIDTKALVQIFRHKVFKMFIRLWRASFQRQDHSRSRQHAHVLAPFGLQRLLWP